MLGVKIGGRSRASTNSKEIIEFGKFSSRMTTETPNFRKMPIDAPSEGMYTNSVNSAKNGQERNKNSESIGKEENPPKEGSLKI